MADPHTKVRMDVPNSPGLIISLLFSILKFSEIFKIYNSTVLLVLLW